MVVFSAGLGLAILVGSMASLRPGPQRWLQFEWNWSMPLWAAAAWLLNNRWWKSVWELQDHPEATPAARKSFLRYSALLALLGIATFLYPIRFAAGENYRALAEGLLKAIAALSFVGWMLYRTGKLILAQDAISERNQTK
jgi:hypothetical protein